MPDMYDKLGELLNEALESGRIPQNNEKNAVVEPIETTAFFNEKVVSTSSTTTKTSSTTTKTSSTTTKASSTTTKRIKIPKKDEKVTGQVIKMHKYTINMHITPEIQKALTTLDIAYPFTLFQLKKQYHKLLKQHHPDRKNTIQNSNAVNNFRQYTIDDIKSAYELLSQLKID